MIVVKDENYRERTAAIGDWWESTENPSCILPCWAPSPGPPETVVGTGEFPAFPALGQPVSEVTVYFSTVVICNKLGTGGA